MTLHAIATSKMRADVSTAHRDFITATRFLMLAKGSPVQAKALAEAHGASRRVEAIVAKAAPGRLGVGESPTGWSDALSDYAQIEAAFVASLRNSSAFDRMLADMVTVPLRTRVAVNGTALVAEETGEAEAKTVFDLAIEGDTLDPQKVAAILVLTKDLVRLGGPAAERLIDRELRNSIVAATDSVFLPRLVAVTTPIASTGNFLEDLSNLLAAATFGADARLYLVLRPEDVAQIATRQEIAGPAFPQLGVNGGSAAGVTIIVSDQLADGTALLVDASQVAAATDPLVLDASEHAAMYLTSDSPQVLVSLWQRDMVGLRAERLFAFHAL